MKVILFGASGTIGSQVDKQLKAGGHEVIRVGKTRGDYTVNIENASEVAALYERIGSFDAVVNAAGDIAFAPFAQLTANQWNVGIRSKFMGQVNLVQQALPYIREKGSFTLISGILSSEYIAGGVAATAINRAIEGFVQAAACDLPKSARINVICPTVLTESMPKYGAYFPGATPVDGEVVGRAYLKSILGVETGKIYQVT